MSAAPIAKERFNFIEGMRGIAAIVVVLTHYCSAYLPAFARVGGATPHFSFEQALSHSPAFALINGTVAVYIFFLMSGFVLAGPLTALHSNLSAQALKRLVRLALPVCSAVAIAAVLALFATRINVAAAELSTSRWLEMVSANDLSLGAVLKDIFLNSMLVGYQGSSIFDATPGIPLTSAMQAINPPTWSLHIEFWGSVLLLITAKIFKSQPRKVFFWISYVTLIFVSGTTPYALFLLGFGAYMARDQIFLRAGAAYSLAGVSMLGVGLWLSYSSEYSNFAAPYEFFRRVFLFNAPSAGHIQYEAAAILLFVGALLTSSVRHLLSSGALVRLGKLSFSIYLIHFPIMLSLGSAGVVFLAQVIPYLWSVAISSALSIAVTLVGAVLFNNAIDTPSISLSRRVYNFSSGGIGAREQASRVRAR